MRLHVPAIPHTVTNEDWSACAFTGKVKRFAPMLRAQGYEVVHYGVEGSESGATEDVVLMSGEEHRALLGIERYHADPAAEVGSAARSDSLCYRTFSFLLRRELTKRLAPGDALCLPFSPCAYQPAYEGLPLVASGEVAVIETGIGYPNPLLDLRVYESRAWQHYMRGREEVATGVALVPGLEWVIPNYYDPSDWPCVERSIEGRDRIVYLGRLSPVKGVQLITALARLRPDLSFALCGQGDPAPFLSDDLPNLRYVPPMHGRARAAYLGDARAVICPSRMTEPFCGVAVEAMLCGTPVITSDFGAFTETVIDGVTGFRCRGLRMWYEALDAVQALDSAAIRQSAIDRFSCTNVGPRYKAVFEEVAELLALQRSRTPPSQTGTLEAPLVD